VSCWRVGGACGWEEAGDAEVQVKRRMEMVGTARMEKDMGI
jgi:hypothetical protein